MIRGPKKQKLGHFVFSTSKLRSELRSGGNSRPASNSRWGQQCASSRKSAFGLMFAFGPAKRVCPAKRVSPAEFEQCFTGNTTSHQQTHFPPASRRPASKRAPQTPVASVALSLHLPPPWPSIHASFLILLFPPRSPTACRPECLCQQSSCQL